MYLTHHCCRACGGTELIPVFDLGVQPLANDFSLACEESAGYAPLLVLFCPRCTLAQLSVTVRPELLYRYYRYVTSASLTMHRHFDWLCGLLREESPALGPVLEIGSNDGLFLDYLKASGFSPVAGCDPAINLCRAANKRGHSSLASVFTSVTAPDCLKAAAVKRFDVIVARHVFCHVDNWMDFFDGLRLVSDPETLICIEVPYAMDMMDRLEFDSIYHEHTSYLTLKAMQALLTRTPFHLHRVVRSDIHGGSLVMLIRHNHSRRPACAIGMSEHIAQQQWVTFNDHSRIKMRRLTRIVHDLAMEGKSVAGYGASAKCTVWCNACKFSAKELSFVTDTTPYKQGRNVPGTNIPVVSDAALAVNRPDYLVLFAWNFQAEILAKESRYLESGGKFIVPVGETWIT